MAMKKIFLSLLVLAAAGARAAGRGGEELFARVVASPAAVCAGDSALFSVVLYATAPIARAECATKFRVDGRGGSGVRKLEVDRDATASRVRENGRVYYTLVWAQYVVSPRGAGKYTVPPQRFKATLRRAVRVPDLFDRMMGAEPEYREERVTGGSEAFAFEVKEKPLRSTREMMRSGSVL